ncbi:MAG: ATPase [Lentimicrobiaceae bacterium]|nr:ATPase [Lentimicrobiaceae bacterium]
MILIADSGSTKTTWCLLSEKKSRPIYLETKGINPNYLAKSSILEILKNELGTPPPYFAEEVREVYFYGSGCSTVRNQKIIRESLLAITPNAAIIVEHDLLGAAISLCGSGKGVACILGTGSNSCFYDGKNIKKETLSLGYLLGDEGGGAYIGKKILYHYLKNHYPQELKTAFEAKYQKTPPEFIASLYGCGNIASFFANFTYFACENIAHRCMQDLVKGCFRDYFREQVLIYEESKHYPIGFVGSIAFIFQKELKEVAEEFQLKVGKIIKNPIEGLIDFHRGK